MTGSLEDLKREAGELTERLEWRIQKWMNQKVGDRTPFIDQDAVLLNDCLKLVHLLSALPSGGQEAREPEQKRAFEDVPSLHTVVLDHFAKAPAAEPAQDALVDVRTIDSFSSKPEEWDQDGDHMLPKWGVTVFFQTKEHAAEFIEKCDAVNRALTGAQTEAGR